MRLFSTLLVAAAFVTGGVSVATACPGEKMAKEKAGPTYALIEVDQLAQWVDAKKAKVFHATSEEKFAKAHIPGATRVDYDGMTADALGAAKDDRVVFYCANTGCGASEKAAKAALKLGFVNVYVYKGGIDGWQAAGKQVATLDAAKKKVRADG